MILNDVSKLLSSFGELSVGSVKLAACQPAYELHSVLILIRSGSVVINGEQHFSKVVELQGCICQFLRSKASHHLRVEFIFICRVLAEG